MERLDNILKSVATAAVVQISANIKEEQQEEEEEGEEEEHETEPKSPGGRRQTFSSLPFKGEVYIHKLYVNIFLLKDLEIYKY